MVYSYIFYFLLSVCFGFLIAYLIERRYRRQPYFKFLADNQLADLPDLPKPIHSVALLGDPGSISDAENDPILILMRKWMEKNGTDGTLLILGDNIYPTGLPPFSGYKREQAEHRIMAQLQTFKQHQGQVIYLSGNHDWNKGRSNGLQYVLEQQEFIRKELNCANSYLPLDGCPGPVSMPLAPGLQLIVINTQWWVQKGVRPIGKNYNCTVDSEEQFFLELSRLLHQHRNDCIVLAAHHPLFSNAQHGGRSTVKQHFFPLTAAHKKLYVPLPVAGSVYPVYRKYFGAYEDMAHPRYRRLRKKLLRLLHQHNNIIYAAGHDHNLQYFPVRGNHYLVSGSGSKTAFVKKGGKAVFTHEHKGFFVVDFYSNNEVWLRVLEPTALLGQSHEVIFQRKIIGT
ncbi:metallophosphoesterase [Adhaeribacter rhizoryzae]|uniref:Metallophosphoesterase n=1 Tax=Adhaeribacter rhizoryzae TaxID=2607907 RepID=A0A5M6DJM9_9BACT|nr:metallophosphoesterase [Adhaeribacter rhizoryzae]KAA5547701.1 metallophosphoesterase [Adhaeribacter rhizoryzae]